MVTKICSKCSIAKSITEYRLVTNKKGRNDKVCSPYYEASCMVCTKAYKRQHRLDNKESYAANKVVYYAEHEEKIKAYKRVWVQENREKLAVQNKILREGKKEYLARKGKEYRATEHGKAVSNAISARYYAKDSNKIKIKARDLVAKALKKAELVRPTECCLCKTTCVPEAHHEDYSKPLEVIWLCKKCHTLRHLNEGQ